ncbi:zona pellucida sperm-binding protein 3-like [Pimephales promelas]|nr:zona pellucida sperm-binding protein 3-like [Pimephales promelas]
MRMSLSTTSLLPTPLRRLQVLRLPGVMVQLLVFNAIVKDDWSYQRPSYSYFLGGVINIKASVKQFNLVPLRVFLDSCVATQVPDCFVDAKTTASSSRFMPRSQVDKIQFQLEAFMFQESNRPSIFITCLLKASRNPVPLPMGGLLLIMTKFMVAVTEHVVLVNLLLLPMEVGSFCSF